MTTRVNERLGTMWNRFVLQVRHVKVPKQVLRKGRATSRYHSKVSESYDERHLKDGGFTFYVKLLGHSPVEDLTGESGLNFDNSGVSRRAVDRIIALYKMVKLQKVSVTITNQGIRVQSLPTKETLLDAPMSGVVFCSNDRKYIKITSIIIRPAEGENLQCYAFLCEKKAIAADLFSRLTIAAQQYASKPENDQPHNASGLSHNTAVFSANNRLSLAPSEGSDGDLAPSRLSASSNNSNNIGLSNADATPNYDPNLFARRLESVPSRKYSSRTSSRGTSRDFNEVNVDVGTHFDIDAHDYNGYSADFKAPKWAPPSDLSLDSGVSPVPMSSASDGWGAASCSEGGATGGSITGNEGFSGESAAAFSLVDVSSPAPSSNLAMPSPAPSSVSTNPFLGFDPNANELPQANGRPTTTAEFLASLDLLPTTHGPIPGFRARCDSDTAIRPSAGMGGGSSSNSLASIDDDFSCFARSRSQTNLNVTMNESSEFWEVF